MIKKSRVAIDQVPAIKNFDEWVDFGSRLVGGIIPTSIAVIFLQNETKAMVFIT